MKFEEFTEFIDDQDEILKQAKGSSFSDRERILSRTVKISEEFGELCDEILASLGDQRNSKMESKKADDLNEEFADVIITCFLLAKSLNIDVLSALKNKTKKILMKHNNDIG